MFFKDGKIKKAKPFNTILIFTIIVFCIFISYLAFNNVYYKSTYASQEETLKQISEKYFLSVSNMRATGNDIYKELGEYRYYVSENEMKSEEEILFKYHYNNWLSKYIMSSDYMETIYVKKDDYVNMVTVSSDAGYQENEDIKQLADEKKNYLYPFIRDIEYIDNDGYKRIKKVYTYVYHQKTPKSESTCDEVIIDYLPEWAEIFKKDSFYDVLIYDADNQLILSTAEQYYENFNKVLTDTKDFGTVELDKDEEKIYTRLGSRGLTFITLLEPDSQFQSFFSMFKNVLLVLIAFLLFNIFIFLYYDKLNRMFKYRSNDLLKKDFFVDYFNGENIENIKNLKKNIKRLKIQINMFQKSRMVLLKVNENAGKDGKDGQKIIADIIKTSFADKRIEMFFIDAYHCVVLVNVISKKELNDKITSVLVETKAIGHAVSHAFVSEEGTIQENGTDLYRQVFTLYERLFMAEKQSIVFYEDISFPLIQYPAHLYQNNEQLIVESINNKNYRKARELIFGIIDSCCEIYYSNTEIILKRMLYVIINEYANDNIHLDAIYDRVNKAKNIEQIKDIVNNLILRFKEGESNEESVKEGYNLIRRIDDYIEFNYKNYELNVTSIAEKMNMSAGYLGQIYKKDKGYSINERIKILRLEKIKEKIQTTNRPIMEIAIEEGIVSKSLLYTSFKQYYGVTPSSMRKSF